MLYIILGSCIVMIGCLEDTNPLLIIGLHLIFLLFITTNQHGFNNKKESRRENIFVNEDLQKKTTIEDIQNF